MVEIFDIKKNTSPVFLSIASWLLSLVRKVRFRDGLELKSQPISSRLRSPSHHEGAALLSVPLMCMAVLPDH